MTDVAEDHTKEQSSLYSELLVVATSVFLFVLVEKLIDRSNDVGGWANIALVGFSAGICLALRGPKASVVSQPTNIIIRVIAIMLGIYVLVSPLSFPSGESAYADSLLIASRVAAFVSVTFSFFSIRYPTFVIVPCVSVLASKAIGTDL
ncbi:drug/metabolite transporter superfamily protein YnfA [Labrenzia sp. EL_142]|nr:drug/metabolite transporter superfamily protein YnfA [Labrenzia sp. EL_142]